LRFARDSADIPDDFFAEKLAKHLWIRRADCKAWFILHRIELPTHWFPAVDAAADQKTPAAGTVAESPSATKSKRFNKEGAKEFVARHCEETEKAGHMSTQKGARKAAQEAGYIGSRLRIDEAFQELKGPLKRGRPRKVKSLEKDGAN
jgi:hypothetical protein